MKMEIRKTDVRDIEIAWMEEGNGPPLLMIMGMAGIMGYWGPELIERLSSDFRVIVFDNRGMGETSAGEKDFTIPEFAMDTKGLMDLLGLDRAHLLGWSMGSFVAQEMAIRYPEKIGKLVLYGSSCGGMQTVLPPAEVMKKLFDTTGTPMELTETALSLMVPGSWLADHPSFRKGFLSQPMSVYVKNIPSIRKQIQSITSWEGTWNRIGSISNETLVITGDEDAVFPLENSRMLYDRIPKSELEVIRGGGHGLIYQYPELFSNIVKDFLSHK